MTHNALFLDRDGVINYDLGYVHKKSDIFFIKGIFDLVRSYHENGYLIFIVTNQSGIGRGFYSEKQFECLMRWISRKFKLHGGKITKVYHCPHLPESDDNSIVCQCRKPSPGLLLSALEEYNIDLNNSVMIGDKASDIEASVSAGIATNLMLRGRYNEKHEAALDIDSLQSAKQYILKCK